MPAYLRRFPVVAEDRRTRARVCVPERSLCLDPDPANKHVRKPNKYSNKKKSKIHLGQTNDESEII